MLQIQLQETIISSKSKRGREKNEELRPPSAQILTFPMVSPGLVGGAAKSPERKVVSEKRDPVCDTMTEKKEN